MVGETRRVRGPAISFEVARRRHGQDRRLDQLAGDEARKARLAETDGEIERGGCIDGYARVSTDGQ
jgi:hypothetical protein